MIQHRLSVLTDEYQKLLEARKNLLVEAVEMESDPGAKEIAILQTNLLRLIKI